MSKTIAFLGLGNMGGPMAKNLIQAKQQVRVFDIMPEALEKIVALGGSKSESANECAKGADIIVTMLPNGKIAESLYLGDQGILKAAKPESLFIDCSTIAPASAKKIAQSALEQKHHIIDAPVSGGTAGADQGTLTFIVGGSANSLEKAKPYLDIMGANIFHAGDNGAGQVAKICNNMLLAIHMIGTSEALNLGTANGLDPKVLSEIMKKSSGGNWSLEKYNPFPGVMPSVPSSNNYNGGFGVPLMLKDLGLSQEAAKDSKVKTPLGELSCDIYQKHFDGEGKNSDFSSIINFLKALS